VSDDILNEAQRRELAAYTGTSVDLNDAELLTRAAERLGMEGELAVDPDGVLELELDDVTVVLEAVADEDRDEVEHPDLLHLAVLLRAASDEERTALNDADLVDDDVTAHGENGEWLPAWWGSICTRLPVDAPISARMEALARVMHEARAVLERRDLTGFFDRIAWLQHDDDDGHETSPGA
jgi:hypothetical protein